MSVSKSIVDVFGRSDLTGPAWYLDRLKKSATLRGHKPQPWPANEDHVPEDEA